MSLISKRTGLPRKLRKFVPPKPYGYSRRRRNRPKTFRPNTLPIRQNLTVSGTLLPSGNSATVDLSVYEKTSVNTPAYWSILNTGVRLPVHSYTEYRQRQRTKMTRLTLLQYGQDPISGLPQTTIIDDNVQATFPSILGFPSLWSLGENPNESDWSVLEARLLAKLADNKANLGEFIGEFHQTRSLFNNTVKRVLLGANYVAHARFLDAAKLFGTTISYKESKKLGKLSTRRGFLRSSSDILSSCWLEFQYGWKPLLSDITGTMIALCERLDPDFPDSSIYKEVKKSYTYDHTEYLPISAPGRNGSYQNHISNRYSMSISYKVVCDTDVLRNQLGLSNPLSIAWNLLPYSFVVDWFVGVGSYLDGITATSGVLFQDGTRTFVHCSEAVGHANFVPDQLNFGSSQYSGTITMSNSVRKKIREVIYDFPSPQLALGSGLTGLHTANLLALLRQRFR